MDVYIPAMPTVMRLAVKLEKRMDTVRAPAEGYKGTHLVSFTIIILAAVSSWSDMAEQI